MKRNPFFDNARLILIFFVVFGHMVQPLRGQADWINTLYLWIYTFHMPAFIFLAGFFAKGARSPKYIMNLAKRILIPYFIFQILYSFYYAWLFNASWKGLFAPQWSLWFLFSLFSWHMLLILFKRIPSVYSLAAAVGIGLLVGYTDFFGHEFSLSRTFVFFPFFLLGYWMTEEQVMKLKRPPVKITALLVLTGIALFAHYGPAFNSGWLFGSKSYAALRMPEYGAAVRALIYAVAAAASLSILAWVPSRQFSFTALGSYTLYVYLLHGFIVRYFRHDGLLQTDSVIGIAGLALLSVFIVWLLSSKYVRYAAEPLIEAKATQWKKLFNRPDKQAKHPGAS